jgi:hypothetical protein
LGALLLPGAADAAWGPTLKCSMSKHCYGISGRPTNYVASIAAEDNEVANVGDWYNNAFYDQEQWVSWPNATYPQNVGWVEAGISEGNRRDCCTAYPFYASENQKGEYHEFLAEGPVASGSGQYNYDLIYDAEKNGVYHVYWSAATNTANWFEVARYGGGRPILIGEQEGGLEVSSEVNPYHAGRQEVAASNGGEWFPWTGVGWLKDPGVCIGANRENGAAGNIEWTPGHNEC